LGVGHNFSESLNISKMFVHAPASDFHYGVTRATEAGGAVHLLPGKLSTFTSKADLASLCNLII